MPKQLIIKRVRFEKVGGRSITIANGRVEYPDGRHCRFSVRLFASDGPEGAVHLITEDINKDTSHIKTITLRRSI